MLCKEYINSLFEMRCIIKSYNSSTNYIQRTNERLTIDTIVEDETGKSMKALDVFSSAIQYLKDHLQNLLIEQGMRDKNEVMKKVRWVLTVPAIWTDPAKEFMKEAAIKVKCLIILVYLVIIEKLKKKLIQSHLLGYLFRKLK